MKKLLFFVLAAFTLLVLVACRENSDLYVPSNQTDVEERGEVEELREQYEQYTEDEEQKSDQTVGIVDYIDRADNHDYIKFARGNWYDGVYTNVFANLTFRLPDGWEYASHEQLDEMTTMAQASPSNPDHNSQMFFDMIAREAFATTSIVIIFEPLPYDDMRANYSAEKYLDGMMSAYRYRQGILYVSEMFDETFGGEQYSAFYVAFTPDTALTYFARRIDDYMLSISILRLELYDVLSYFS